MSRILITFIFVFYTYGCGVKNVTVTLKNPNLPASENNDADKTKKVDPVKKETSYTQPAPVEVKVVPHRIFVTSTIYPSDLGGLEGADAKCAARAAAAGLSGQWKAIISSSTVDAKDRVVINGPVKNLGDAVIAENSEDFFDGSFPPILLNEKNESVSADENMYKYYTWTGTTAAGLRDPSGRFCNDWQAGAASGTYGLVGRHSLAGADTLRLNGSVNSPCGGQTSRLYCLEQFSPQ